MRTRGIKPGFWKNENLADCSPYARLLYIGLWSMCDWEGRTEYRAKRIKAELFPYNADIDMETCFLELQERGFVVFYENAKFLYVPNFTKHQNPHKNERSTPSSCPKPTKDNICLLQDGTGTELGRNLDGTSRAVHCSLFTVPCIPEDGSQTEDGDTEANGGTDSAEVKTKPIPNLAARRRKVIDAYNPIAERNDWFVVDGKPNGTAMDLLNKFCEDEYRFGKLDEYMGKVAQSTMEACRINVFLTKKAFNGIMCGAWNKSKEAERKGGVNGPSLPQEALDLSKPWNRPPEPEKRSTGIWDIPEGII